MIYYTILLVVLFIILLFLFNSNIFGIKENFSSNNKEKNKICCFYAYYEKDDLYKKNFEYFLKNGILDNVDYYIILNGDCSVAINNSPNINILKRKNKGYDFGAYSYAIKQLKKIYNYYFFLNTSVRGPYLNNHYTSNKNWTDYFIDLFNKKDIKIVGTSINIFPFNLFENYNLKVLYKKK